MKPALLTFTVSVIMAASRQYPVDKLLRDRLKAQRNLSREEAALVSKAAFAYFRWLKWLNERDSIPDRLERALELSRQYAADPRAFPDSELVANAIPGWVVSEMSVTPEWVRALQAEPKLWLRAKPGQGRVLARRLGGCRPFGEGSFSDILEYRGSADLFRVPEFQRGAFELQDISSQAVGLVCAPEPKSTWLDACAGEGGKTLHLSDLMGNTGLIWASDKASWRLQTLKLRAARARVFNYRSALWTGGANLPTKTKFDGVLVDAPCSGLGTWQRNPHAKWTTTPEDVSDLGKLQSRLLTHASAGVKPGGKLVYAVCTLLPVETSEVARTFDLQSTEFERLPIMNPLIPAASPEPELLLWPQDFGGNGMYIVAWRRK